MDAPHADGGPARSTRATHLRTTLVLVGLLAAVLLATAPSVAARTLTTAHGTPKADALYARATRAERAHLFTSATALYAHARDLYLAARDEAGARACLTGMHDVEAVVASYPFTRSEVLDQIAERFPDSTPAERAAWLDSPTTERMRWDGRLHYFSDVPVNLAYRDVDLFQTQPALVAKYRRYYDTLRAYIPVAASTPARQQYGVPRTWSFTQRLTVPRDRLPPTGELDLWLPVPIVGGAQSAVQVGDVTPAGFVRNPPSIDQGIGLLALAIPLEALNGDLVVGSTVSYERSAEYFKIDPDHVGRYDTGSWLYRHYTASRGNTRVTPSIRRTAQRVVAGEKDPYLAAKRLYEYVIGTVTYSYTPHMALFPRGVPESVYVHEHRYGDCGAQSMYFSALCRSIGIPARCAGGFQLFSGTPSGHFWAEFYLPDHGWVPVDPTAATMVDYLPDVPAADREAFHDFYFGNLDDLRLTVQNDTDLPFVPAAEARTLISLCVQNPAALCDTMSELPEAVLWEYWSFE